MTAVDDRPWPLARYAGCTCGGEHYTTGDRAWCLDCREWCYPNAVCEVAELRAAERWAVAEREVGDQAMALLKRTLPLLVRLGDFIGNGEVDPDRPDSLGERCDLIGDIRQLLEEAGRD